MTTTNIDLTLYSGETKSISVTAISHTIPFPLNGAVIKWVMQRTLDDSSPIIVYKDTSNGITITDEAGGRFIIRLDATDTRSISSGTYHHIAKVIDHSFDESIAFTGLITILKSSKNL